MVSVAPYRFHLYIIALADPLGCFHDDPYHFLAQKSLPIFHRKHCRPADRSVVQPRIIGCLSLAVSVTIHLTAN